MYNVISKLNKGESFIGYRDSKLTRMLQPYLGGNCLTAIINTVSALASNYQETLNTMKFALCAGGIKNDVKINMKKLETENPYLVLAEKEVKEQAERIQTIQCEITAQKQLNKEMEIEYTMQTKELEELFHTYKEALELKSLLHNSKKEKQETAARMQVEISQKQQELESEKARLKELEANGEEAALKAERDRLQESIDEFEKKADELEVRRRELELEVEGIEREIQQKDQTIGDLRSKGDDMKRLKSMCKQACGKRSMILEVEDDDEIDDYEHEWMLEKIKKEVELMEVIATHEKLLVELKEMVEEDRDERISKLIEKVKKKRTSGGDMSNCKETIDDTITVDEDEPKCVQSLTLSDESEVCSLKYPQQNMSFKYFNEVIHESCFAKPPKSIISQRLESKSKPAMPSSPIKKVSVKDADSVCNSTRSSKCDPSDMYLGKRSVTSIASHTSQYVLTPLSNH